MTVEPAGPNSDTNGDGKPDTDPAVNYGAVNHFRVAGFNTVPDTAGIGGNGVRGALIGVVILPRTGGGDVYRATVLINVAADKGVSYTFSEPLIPEPTGIGVLGICAMGLWGSMRRRTRRG